MLEIMDRKEDGKIMAWNVDGMMERMLHDVSIAEVIINLFLQDIPSQIEKLSESIAEGNIKQIQYHAHSIKGSAANVGGEVMQTTASSIEEKAIEGNLDDIQRLQSSLETHFNELQNLLTDYLETLNNVS